jgi:hypothetical protein
MAKRLTPTVKCEVCYNRFKSLAGHLRKHGLTAKAYKKEFPGAPIVSPLTRRRLQIARLKFIFKKKGKVGPQTPKGLKISIANSGRKHSPEAVEKIRQARIGSTLSEEHKLAISAGLLGHEVSEETRKKLSEVEFTDERRRKISEAQSAEKGNAWKGGVSRYLYFGKGKHRLKKIFGDPLKCFYPGCDVVEGKNVRAVDCHHLDGNHENNPLDGSNWLPLCRRHHMLADGRLKTASVEEVREARKLALKAHKDHMKKHYVGEIKTYHE